MDLRYPYNQYAEAYRMKNPVSLCTYSLYFSSSFFIIIGQTFNKAVDYQFPAFFV